MLAEKPLSRSLAFPARCPSRALFVPVVRSDSDVTLTPLRRAEPPSRLSFLLFLGPGLG